MESTSIYNETELSDNTLFLLNRHMKCMDIKNQTDSIPGIENYCQTAYDGWTCWNATAPGESAIMPCPSFVPGFDPSRFAFRKCNENSTWFQHPESGLPWSNYTTCIDMQDYEFRRLVNRLYMTGYSISLFALITSLIIFKSYRSLRCTRIAIHVHLFLSLALNNISWILWYNTVVEDTEITQGNNLYCQLLHLLTEYYMVTNYMWMFCESLHLHLALVIVFVRDRYAMQWFYFIGWIVPFILILIYAVIRYYYLQDTQLCWLNESSASWVIIVPVAVSIIFSLIFLINVMRILLTKLHINSANPPPIGIRKAARAALILIPLFGLQHLLIAFRPKEKTTAEILYEISSAILVSFQGLCVSVLFCFGNVDVHSAIKMSYRKMQRNGTAVTHITATTHQHSVARDAV